MYVLVHYSEIGTKGRNRAFFEKRLAKNIGEAINAKKITRLFGKIFLEAGENGENEKILQHIPGIAHFSFCKIVEPEMDAIKDAVVNIAKKSKAKSFRINASRSDKSFAHNSLQLNDILGEYVRTKAKKKVKLEDPELTIFVEIDRNHAFVYSEKIKGVGGLPVGCSGKVICLLSGGIDSPVAAWKMMKRGCTVVLVHFHTYTSKIENKISMIAETLSKYQPRTRVYFVPFYEVQEDIIKNVPERYRMIVYRRMMFRIAEHIMEKENARGFVTGDSLAQVASQTLENLDSIYSSTKYPVFAPLIGYDKKEIIWLAESIGTYASSIIPYKDCCSFLVRKPATAAKKDVVEGFDSVLDAGLVEDAIKRAEIVDI